MSMPLWAIEEAKAFWALVGETEPFPRDLRIPIAYALPLTLVLLPRLHVQDVLDWLEHHGVPHDVRVRDRALRACLVARTGNGIVFLDGADTPSEQRFSLAHELAHFLRHYLRPRRDAEGSLGHQVLEVLDGIREPQPDERIRSLLAQVPIGFHVHLMERLPDGDAASASIGAAEHEADLLALELLAPSVLVDAGPQRAPSELQGERLCALLLDEFGLPPDAARRYAAYLSPPSPPPPSFVRLLTS